MATSFNPRTSSLQMWHEQVKYGFVLYAGGEDTCGIRIVLLIQKGLTR